MCFYFSLGLDIFFGSEAFLDFICLSVIKGICNKLQPKCFNQSNKFTDIIYVNYMIITRKWLLQTNLDITKFCRHYGLHSCYNNQITYLQMNCKWIQKERLKL